MTILLNHLDPKATLEKSFTASSVTIDVFPEEKIRIIEECCEKFPETRVLFKISEKSEQTDITHLFTILEG